MLGRLISCILDRLMSFELDQLTSYILDRLVSYIRLTDELDITHMMSFMLDCLMS